MTFNTVVADIKKRIDIVDFLGGLITLKKAGKNYTAICPFHTEKTPSFMVSPDRQVWRCFGACQEGGDVISFLMKWENLTFSEAVKELAEKAGVKLDDMKVDDHTWKIKEKILLMNQHAAKYYHYVLTQHKAGKEALDYVSNRGLSDKLIETFQLGYSPQSWDGLLTYLKKKKFSEADAVEAGLVIKNDRGNTFDRFRGRLMFPIMNARHEVLGFSGRLIKPDEKQAKYVNSAETPVYRKRETLYGMHVAHEAIRKEDVAILTEGEFDMISSYKHGISNTVAIKGSAVTKDQLMLLKRYTKRIILALDADFSGSETTLRAIKDAEAMDFRIDVIQFGDLGKDPDEALEKNATEYKKRVKKPVPLYDFIIDTAFKKFSDKDAYAKKEIANVVAPFLSHIMNPIVKGHYTKRLADMLEIHERDIESSIRNMERKDMQSRSQTSTVQKNPENRYEILQRYILSYMLQHEKPLETFVKISSKIDREDFSIPSLQDIFGLFNDYLQKQAITVNFNLQTFLENFSEPLQAVLDDLFLLDLSALSQNENPESSLKKSILELKQLSLRSQMKLAMQNSDSQTKIADISKKLATVEKELHTL